MPNGKKLGKKATKKVENRVGFLTVFSLLHVNVDAEWIQLSITLTSLSVAGWMILPYWQALLGRPSRMLANASYTFWVVSNTLHTHTI